MCVLAVVSLVVLAHPADAVDGRAIRHGACSVQSHWTLRVVRDGGIVRVRLAVRDGGAGQRWNIFMDHNGTGFFAGYRISDPTGFWVVRRRVRTSSAPTRSASAPTTSSPARPAAVEPPFKDRGRTTRSRCAADRLADTFARGVRIEPEP